MNYYEALGVSPQVTTAEINKAYRAVARVCHPDVAGDNEEAAVRFRQAKEAYETLKDPFTRRDYDRSLEPIRSIGMLFRTSDGQRLTAAMLPSAPKAPKPGIDTASVIEVDPELYAQGGLVEVPIVGGQTAVWKMPPRSSARSSGILKGLGELGSNGARRGDHFVIVLPKRG